MLGGTKENTVLPAARIIDFSKKKQTEKISWWTNLVGVPGGDEIGYFEPLIIVDHVTCQYDAVLSLREGPSPQTGFQRV